MATETVKTRTAGLELENGTDSQGNVKLVTLSLGSLAKERWDGDKALAIIDRLEDCLSKTVASAYTTVKSTLTA